jgi:GNAT superfamily N-acetyltransferase
MGDQADPVTLEPVGENRRDALFDLFAQIVADGDGFPQAAPLTPEIFEGTWVTSATSIIGAFRGDELLGAYYLKPNFAARAAHVANAGYIVGRPARGAGVGRRLVEHSIAQAHADGYTAVIFNLVFESNPARALYEELGWRQIGRIPRGVDDEPAIIYWRDV